MSPFYTFDESGHQIGDTKPKMPSKLSSCVIGIDVGGTNTDAVILQGEEVVEWYKTPTTSDIQTGVERAIEEVVKKAKIPSNHVDSVKIGTTVRNFSAVFEFRRAGPRCDLHPSRRSTRASPSALMKKTEVLSLLQRAQRVT